MYGIRAEQLGNRHLIEGARFGNVALIVFLLAQASDGVLTYIGVSTFGPTAEGNPIVSWLMMSMGNGAGVTTAKLAAALFGIALHLSDVHKAVAALAGVYFVLAVGPWLALLFVLN